jgi:hypothetical protein
VFCEPCNWWNGSTCASSISHKVDIHFQKCSLVWLVNKEPLRISHFLIHNEAEHSLVYSLTNWTAFIIPFAYLFCWIVHFSYQPVELDRNP